MLQTTSDKVRLRYGGTLLYHRLVWVTQPSDSVPRWKTYLLGDMFCAQRVANYSVAVSYNKKEEERKLRTAKEKGSHSRQWYQATARKSPKSYPPCRIFDREAVPGKYVLGPKTPTLPGGSRHTHAGVEPRNVFPTRLLTSRWRAIYPPKNEFREEWKCNNLMTNPIWYGGVAYSRYMCSKRNEM